MVTDPKKTSSRDTVAGILGPERAKGKIMISVDGATKVINAMRSMQKRKTETDLRIDAGRFAAGLRQEDSVDKKKKNIDVCDQLNSIASKLTFLADCVGSSGKTPFRLSTDGQNGFSLVLDGLSEEIQKISAELD
jgi:hypothetical protein